MKLKELMKEYIEGRVKEDTEILCTCGNEKEILPLRSVFPEYSIDTLYEFEIVKHKSKMYVHEFYADITDIEDCEIIKVRSNLEWVEYKSRYWNHAELIKTEEIEVDID